MDDELSPVVVSILFIGSFVLVPTFFLVSIVTCSAYFRTKKWQKERDLKQRRTESLEANPLVDDGSDSEDDFVDSADEADYYARKAEEEADAHLTFQQKFWKEFRGSWCNNRVEDERKKKEREERKKMAKAVARQLDRMQKRRQRREVETAGASSEGDIELPSYKKATAQGVKGDT